MTTKIAATFALILSAISFVGWLAGVTPDEPQVTLPAIVEGH